MQRDAFLQSEVKAGDPISAAMFTRVLQIIGKQDFSGGNVPLGVGLQMAYMIESATPANKLVPSRFKIRFATYSEEKDDKAVVDTTEYEEVAFNYYNTGIKVSPGKVRMCWLINQTLLLADCAEFDATELDHEMTP